MELTLLLQHIQVLPCALGSLGLTGGSQQPALMLCIPGAVDNLEKKLLELSRGARFSPPPACPGRKN